MEQDVQYINIAKHIIAALALPVDSFQCF